MGFNVLTPFQRKLIPLILDGKDVEARFEPGSGKTAGFIAALMLQSRGERAGAAAGRGARSLILVADVEELRKIAREHLRFSRIMRDPPALLTLGDTEDSRREQRRLESDPAIVAGTTERVIDHIRRGSLSLGRLAHVVVERPGGELAEDFDRDVQFIFAKLPERRQTLLFSGGPAAAAQGAEQGMAGPKEETAGIPALLRRPTLISSTETAPAEKFLGFAVFRVPRPDKTELLARIILARRVSSAFVVVSPRTNGEAVARRLVSLLIRAASVSPGIGPVARKKIFTSFSLRELEVLVSAQPPVDLEPSGTGLLVLYDLPTGRAGPAGREGPRHGGESLVVFVESDQGRDLARFQETYGVAMKEEENPAEDAVIQGAIERIVRRIKEEENPGELGKLRSLIRRQVPFLLRSYLTAYLLKTQLPRLGGGPAKEPPAEQKPRRPEQRGRQKQEREPERLAARGTRVPPREPPSARGSGTRVPAHEASAPRGRDFSRAASGAGQFIQLFVSIGRNRRVFPRDLGDFFVEKLKLRADEIGSVRVFDKYSFVEISSGRAQEAITRLSGSEFKGRPITVNFAKKKEEKEGT